MDGVREKSQETSHKKNTSRFSVGQVRPALRIGSTKRAKPQIKWQKPRKEGRARAIRVKFPDLRIESNDSISRTTKDLFGQTAQQLLGTKPTTIKKIAISFNPAFSFSFLFLSLQRQLPLHPAAVTTTFEIFNSDLPTMSSLSVRTSRKFLATPGAAVSGIATRRSISSAPPSAASRLIQRRATTGSVSSVFYLKNLPGEAGKQHKQQAAFVENVFTGLVGVPIACLGLGGLYRMASDGKL